MSVKIRIGEECISFLNPFDGKVIFTIWNIDFENVKKAFQDSKNYKNEATNIRKKYDRN